MPGFGNCEQLVRRRFVNSRNQRVYVDFPDFHTKLAHVPISGTSTPENGL